MKRRLQVMKFGGTSVGDAACIARTAKIIADGAKATHCVAVVSAMSSVTNRLIEAANLAQSGDAAGAIAAKSGSQDSGQCARGGRVSGESLESSRAGWPLAAKTRNSSWRTTGS